MMNFTNLEQDNMKELAEKAYIYGFPLVFGIQQIKRYLLLGMEGTPAPLNTLSHATHLSNDEDTFVSVNNDTLYSWGGIDLSVGPVVLHVPDTNNRYYVGQFIDVWSNNFAYIGQRSTGCKAQDFYLVPPNYDGPVPDNMIKIEFPTTVGIIVLRWSITGIEELPIIKELQAQTTITLENPENQGLGIPDISADVPESLQFFESMRVFINTFPSSVSDQVQIENQFERLGLLEKNQSLTMSEDAEVLEALKEASANGVPLIQQMIQEKNSSINSINGWDLSLHMFDYNDRYFEVGTINEPKWIIANRSEAIVQRTLAAMSGLWGNNSYEAVYPTIWTDNQGEELHGQESYSVTFKPVPTNGFWSLTMYDVPDFYLVKNPINRYSLGDRTKGIIYNEDGSLTITLSSVEPTEEKARANWLPTPPGKFRPMLRVYQPKEELLEGKYELPEIKKMG